MYKDLKGIPVRGGGSYTEFMKSSRRHDAKSAKSKALHSKTGMLSRGIAKRNEEGKKSGWGAKFEEK